MRSFPTHVTRQDLDKCRPQFGLISPASDILIERDFWRMGFVADVDIFRGAGIEITDVCRLGLLTDAEIAVPGPDHYRTVLDAMDLSGAEAIFLPCTTSRALDAVAPLEQQTGLPVITSNQALFWHGLSLTGHAHAITGFGRLLA